MYSFDLRGTLIPFSLLRISSLFKEMLPEETMNVFFSSSEISADILKVLPAEMVEVVLLEEIEGDEPGFQMMLKKKISKYNLKPKEKFCARNHSKID